MHDGASRGEAKSCTAHTPRNAADALTHAVVLAHYGRTFTGGARVYYGIEQSLKLVDEPHRSVCLRILHENRELFERVQGSTHNHQAWTGGYLDHVQEVLNIGRVLYDGLGSLRPLAFTLSDALFVLFLHDIEKPWKYRIDCDGNLENIPELHDKAARHAFRLKKLDEYGIVLNDEQLNALKYVEGELDDYTNTRRVMGPLAAFCHLADVTSARIWFDYPSDAWPGATRERLTV
jgi:hypothetical protein